MISYVWNINFPLRPGVGGTENFTLGQVRELLRRGISTEIITPWQPASETQPFFPDIPIRQLSPLALAKLDNTVVFASIPAPFHTKHRSFVNLPYPAHTAATKKRRILKGLDGKILLAPSHAAAEAWAKVLECPRAEIQIVHPFAMPDFAAAVSQAAKPNSPQKILYASRLIADKGIFTLLHAWHLLQRMTTAELSFTVTNAGNSTPEGTMLERLIAAHGAFQIANARKTAQSMAQLMADHDVLVVPSSSQWQEPFGMVSVEAQHAGCRVVASDIAGLPETDCGGLILSRPDDPQSLASSILKAVQLGRLSPIKRARASKKFTVKQSVDSLLGAMRHAGTTW